MSRLGLELARPDGTGIDPERFAEAFRTLSSEEVRKCLEVLRLVADTCRTDGVERVPTRRGECSPDPPRPGQYTLHDESHIRAVLWLLFRLLQAAPADWLAWPGRVRMLVIGAIVHDVGMCLGPREDHGPNGARWVADTLPRAGLVDRADIGDVQKFCTYHSSSGDLRDLALLPDGIVELVALVRLADALDVGPERAPSEALEAAFEDELEAWRDNLPTGKIQERELHFVLNHTVRLAKERLCGHSHTILLVPSYPDERVQCVPEFARQLLQAELDSIGPYAPKWLGCRDVIFPQRYQADAFAWRGWELYALYVVATLMSTLRKEMLSSSDLVTFLAGAVDLLTQDPVDGAKAKEDARRLAVAVLESRPQLHALRWLTLLILRTWDENCHCSELRRALECFEEYRTQAIAEAGEAAARELEGRPHDHILVFGFGGPVRATIEALARRPREGPLEVTTPLLRPVAEGRRPRVYELRDELPNVTVRVIADEQIMQAYEQQSAIVLMGCEALKPNGDIVNSSGAHLVARAAKEREWPVYVVTESLKVRPPDTGDPRVPPWGIPRISASSFAHGKDEKRIVRDTNLIPAGENSETERELPLAEEVPARLVQAVVTEFGASTPEDAGAQIVAGAERPEEEDGWPELLRRLT